MIEFEVGGVTYRAGKLNVRTQAHLLKRITPLVAAIKDAMPSPTDGQDVSIFDLKVKPLAEALRDLPDKDLDFIMDTCMSIVQRKQDGDRGWANVWSASAGQAMFDDIDLVATLTICMRVIIGAIGPFSFASLL